MAKVSDVILQYQAQTQQAQQRAGQLVYSMMLQEMQNRREDNWRNWQKTMDAARLKMSVAKYDRMVSQDKAAQANADRNYLLAQTQEKRLGEGAERKKALDAANLYWLQHPEEWARREAAGKRKGEQPTLTEMAIEAGVGGLRKMFGLMSPKEREAYRKRSGYLKAQQEFGVPKSLSPGQLLDQEQLDAYNDWLERNPNATPQQRLDLFMGLKSGTSGAFRQEIKEALEVDRMVATRNEEKRKAAEYIHEKMNAIIKSGQWDIEEFSAAYFAMARNLLQAAYGPDQADIIDAAIAGLYKRQEEKRQAGL